MGELARRNKLLRAMETVELDPIAADREISAGSYRKLPLSRLTALGTGLEPIAAAVGQLAGHGGAVSGYYKVTIPPGTHLAQFAKGGDFLGTALSDANNAIQSQARLSPLVCNPAMLFMAATLFSMDQKLDSIQETQREMLDFVVQKQKSELKGDLDFLMDVWNHYKYNWNDETYKTANHMKALDIRQEAGRKVDFYREQIKKHLGKRPLLHGDQEVRKQLAKVQDIFQDYQLALYLYGFSYFLEALLQENFASAYLDAISDKMDKMSIQYRELYSLAYTQLENRSRSSVQSRLLGGGAAASKVMGHAIAKIPLLSKGSLDESLIAAGERLEDYEESRTYATLRRLVERQSNCVRPFIEQLETLSHIYNRPMELICSGEALYIGENTAAATPC